MDEGGVRAAAHEAERHRELDRLLEEALPERHFEPTKEPVPATSQGDEEQGRTTGWSSVATINTKPGLRRFFSDRAAEATPDVIYYQ